MYEPWISSSCQLASVQVLGVVVGYAKSVVGRSCSGLVAPLLTPAYHSDKVGTKVLYCGCSAHSLLCIHIVILICLKYLIILPVKKVKFIIYLIH